jgi:mono/diheme cytochrome c family protein
MKWLKRAALILCGAIVVAMATLYGGSEWMLRRAYAAPLDTIVADHSAAGVAEGGRIARIIGCRGCHASDATGRVLVENALLGRFAAPALARRAADYSDAQLSRLIRHGIKRDGTALHVMPVQAFRHLSDDDVARLIGWIRTLKPQSKDLPGTISYGPMARLLILTGGLPSQAHPETIAGHHRPVAAGAYFVHVSCMACHDLRHAQPQETDPTVTVPALADVGSSYDANAFRHLLRTGVGMSGRDLGLMTRVATTDLSRLTDNEIAAVHTYLIEEHQRPATQ